MIISQFHLPFRVATDDPGFSFEIYLTNLEAVELRFRFRFVAPVLDAAILPRLRDRTAPHGEEVSGSALLGFHDWVQSGGVFVARWERVVAAGATKREGLAATGSLLPAGSAGPVFFQSRVRGYWELTLPPISSTPRAPPKAQLSHDARVLIACFGQTWNSRDGHQIRDEKVPFPLASGRAEHLIPAEKSDVSPSAPVIGVGTFTKRVAPKRKAARGRRR